jgi:hypothetical protein
MVKTAISSLYNASADIYTYHSKVDDNHITTKTLKLAAGEIRCRISYLSMGIANSSDINDTQDSTIKLIYDGAGISIPAGSRIHITWDDGRTDEYENTSVPAVYSHHAEISLIRVRTRP